MMPFGLNLGMAIYRQKELYDTKVHGQAFKVGDLVWLNNPVMARVYHGNCTTPGADPIQ